MAPLDLGDAAFVHEAADVADVDAEGLSYRGDRVHVAACLDGRADLLLTRNTADLAGRRSCALPAASPRQTLAPRRVGQSVG